jgi:hypothetical protein
MPTEVKHSMCVIYKSKHLMSDEVHLDKFSNYPIKIISIVIEMELDILTIK